MSKQRVSVLVLTLIGSILAISSLFPLNAQESSLALPESASRNVYQLIQNGGFETAGAGAGGAQAWEGNNLRPADKRVCTADASSHGECGFRFNNALQLNTQRSITQIYNPATPFGNRDDELFFGYTIRIPTLTEGTSFTVTARIDYMNTSFAPDIFTRSYTTPINLDSFMEDEGFLTLKGRADKLTVTFRMTKPGVGRVFVDRVRVTLHTNLPTHTPTITPTMSLTSSRTPTATNTPATPCLTFNADVNAPRTTQCPPTKTYTPTNTPTKTQTPSLTPSYSPSPTPTPSHTPTLIPTEVPGG